MKRIAWILGFLFLLLCAFGGYLAKGMKKTEAKDDKVAAVTKGDVEVNVIDTGTVDAVKTVEVKSRVSGRLAKLLVDEGDKVVQGQLIAIIDPKETRLLVDQGRAQLRGAQSAVGKAALEIRQRRQTALAAYEQAKSRLAQLEAEASAQPTLTTAAIDQAQSGLNSALKEKERLIESSHPSQRATAESNVREARANFDAAQLDYQRQQDLLAKEFTSTKTVEGARQNVEVAKARLDSANESLQRLDAQLAAELSKADDQIKQARAQLTQAKANAIQDKVKREDYLSQVQAVATAKAALEDVPIMAKGMQQNQAQADQLASSLADSERQLGETEIRAPISGIVTKKLIQEGELVANLSSFSSGTPIVSIEDRSSMIVRMDVNEIDTARMVVGMPTAITVDALPDLQLKGKVRKIAPASTTSTTAGADPVVKYQVEVTVLDHDERLRSGMSAKATLNVASRKGVLTLPIEYIIKEDQKRFLEIPSKGPLKPDEKRERREIKTGLENGSVVEILSGAKEGEKFYRPEFNGPKRKGFIEGGGD